MKKWLLTCACCGGCAGKFVQWFNQDTGFGLCANCRDWMLAPRDGKPPRETTESVREMFGLPGVHYAAFADKP